MYRLILPDGTFIQADTKAELYALAAQYREDYEGYLS